MSGPTPRPPLDKLAEELAELQQAVAEDSNIEEELGDLLFAAVKVARFFHIDAEEALAGTCEKFIRRFSGVEAAVTARQDHARPGRGPADGPVEPGEAPGTTREENKRGETPMNKTELILSIAEETGFSRKDVEIGLNAAIHQITKALVEGEKIQIVGFGAFETKVRAERMGRNPKTGGEHSHPRHQDPGLQGGEGAEGRGRPVKQEIRDPLRWGPEFEDCGMTRAGEAGTHAEKIKPLAEPGFYDFVCSAGRGRRKSATAVLAKQDTPERLLRGVVLLFYSSLYMRAAFSLPFISVTERTSRVTVRAPKRISSWSPTFTS